MNIPDDKLSNRQLTGLIDFKKSKDDTFIIFKMKKSELKPLWNQLKDHPNPTFQMPNDTNDTNMPTASTTTLPEHQQTLIDEAETELESHAGNDFRSFETANDTSDTIDMITTNNVDTDMITATPLPEHQQTLAVVDEAELESHAGADVPQPTFVLLLSDSI